MNWKHCCFYLFIIIIMVSPYLLFSYEFKFFSQKEDQQDIRQALKDLDKNVSLLVFMEENCTFCAQIKSMTEELPLLSNRVRTRIYSPDKDKKVISSYNIERFPAIVVMSDRDHGIRFYGFPGGYEFMAFLSAIKLVSGNRALLAEDLQQKIKGIKNKMVIRVFVTLSCPYCSKAVETAHNIAWLNSNITAEMINASEFQQMAAENNVRSVPKVVISNSSTGLKTDFLGALPDDMFIDKLLSVAE